jgi:hypothetical protein
VWVNTARMTRTRAAHAYKERVPQRRTALLLWRVVARVSVVEVEEESLELHRGVAQLLRDLFVVTRRNETSERKPMKRKGWGGGAKAKAKAKEGEGDGRPSRGVGRWQSRGRCRRQEGATRYQEQDYHCLPPIQLWWESSLASSPHLRECG